jgi:peptide-methionine (S)-S-oxide reductase
MMKPQLLLLITVLSLFGTASCHSPENAAAADTPVPAKAPSGEKDKETMKNTEKATFGAGCFWGVEVTFRNTEGVVDATAGYMGGTVDNPAYKDVCTGETGHAEVVQVEYDPETISYEELLDVFWRCHNPTTLNRQGPDFGSQYRSVIFYHTDAQRTAAEKSKAAHDGSGRYSSPVVTAISPAQNFWRAEEYHQRYLEKHGRATCRI